ncbi:MAG: hypothetical protein HYW05_01230 [Candidatus Diapherotrites archaeon]|nr:hypothetical protein [Candidatus Diapherotrites archaeon]
MNITLSVSGELETLVKSHRQIKWTEIAREAIRKEAKRMKKLEILQKYMERKPITEEEWDWMDEIDWHPVDEMNYKPEFVKEAMQASKSRPKRIKSLDELLK